MIPHLTVSPAETTLEGNPSTTTTTTSNTTTSASSPSSSSSSRQTNSISPTPSLSPEPTSTTSEKKPLKKRKSWGQELPIPKTNLPPRKRAKTEDEKEQRRIERVLRNRAAAQTSRERKRLEVEKLETEKKKVENENTLLLQRLAAMEAENHRLAAQVAQLSAEIHGHGHASPHIFSPPASSVESPGCTGAVDMVSTPPPSATTAPSTTTTTTAPPEMGRGQSPTLSPTLFKQEYREKSSIGRLPLIPEFNAAASTTNVNAAAAVDGTTTTVDGVSHANGFSAKTSDMTQHPAAMLCDLQCQSEPSAETSRSSETPATTRTTRTTAATTTTTTTTTQHQQPPHPASPSPPSTTSSTNTITSAQYRLCQAMVSTTCSLASLTPLGVILRCLKEGTSLPISLPAGSTGSDTGHLDRDVEGLESELESGGSSIRTLPLILWLISTPILPLSLRTMVSPRVRTTSVVSRNPTIATATATRKSSRSSPRNKTRISSSNPPPATTTSTTTTKSQPKPTSKTTHLPHHQHTPVFRLRLLTRLLACSPALARPLRDATGRALQRGIERGVFAVGKSGGRGGDVRGGDCLRDIGIGSGDDVDDDDVVDGVGEGRYGWEFLMTVMWVVDCWMRERRIAQRGNSRVVEKCAVGAGVVKGKERERRVKKKGRSRRSARPKRAGLN